MKTKVSLKKMKTMKKYSIILSAVLSIIALASCQKEQDIKEQDIIQEEVKENVPSSIPFTLRANIPSVDTKTTLNTSTWAVNWESTDVIYAVTTDKAWGQDYEDDNSGETIAVFAYDSESGTFSTDKAISDGEHTFNFLYSAGNQKSYHRGGSTTFQLAGTQTFDASAPTASLKLYDALAAQVVATTPTSFADVDMSHLFSLMKVTLKNKTGDAVNITKFEIEIPDENLYGIFNVNFNTTPSTTYNRNGGDKITVNISNGTVAADGTLDVYFVMGPVAGYAGEVTFTVTDSESNTYTKTNNISAPGVTFAAGTYNTASYSLKTADPVQCVTLDWNYAGGTSSDLLAIPGVSANGLGSDYADSHAPYRVKFDNTGDYIQVRTDAAISTVSVGYKMIGGNTTSSLTFKESANGSDWNDVQTLNISGSASSTGTLTTTNPFNEASRFVQIYFTKGSNVGIGAISITKPNTDPVINVTSDNPMAVSNENDLYAIEYSISNPTGASISASADVAWIHDFNYSVDGEVSFEVDAQSPGAAAREGVITLSYTGASDVEVTVNQAAGASSGSGPQTLFLESFGSNNNNVVIASHSDFSASQSMFTDPVNTVVSHYSSDGKVGKKTTNPSDGYSGASGNSAMWYTGTKNTDLTINLFTVDKINISDASALSVSFGLYYANGTIGTTNTVTAYYKIDNGEEQTLSFSQPASTGSWALCTGTISGTGSSLKIRFEQHVTGGYTARVDDIKVVGTN